jgi:hypothetical protein
MVCFLKLVAFLDYFRTILGPKKWSKNATNFKKRTMVLIGNKNQIKKSVEFLKKIDII